MWETEERFYTQQQVMDRMDRFREDNFYPTWKAIAEKSDLTYTYVIAWKNKDLTLGQTALRKLVRFLESQGY